MMKKIVSGAVFLLITFSYFLVQAINFKVEKSTFVYKTIDGVKLEMVMYKPETELKQLPAIVFFFGGGWINGDPTQFQHQAEYFASRGMVAFCADYRTQSKHGTTPFESVKDARSAIRYLKLHGKELNIDTAKIVASGGSAGGHLALCTALIDDINEKGDEMSVSPVPFALVLFNPVVDTGKKGYSKGIPQGREFEISPVHHITDHVPPVLIMHGNEDETVVPENVIRFNYLMKQRSNKSTLELYKKQDHGFFNYNVSLKYFRKTLLRSEEFLENFNLLKGESWVKKYPKS